MYDSGVVFADGITSSPIMLSIVPIRPVLIPDSSNIERTIYVEVVFPFVPVIPMVVSSFAGLPKYAADETAKASLVFFTFITVTSPDTSTSFSTISAFAPDFTTSSAKSCPSLTAPLIHTKTLPCSTFRESYTSVVTSMSVLPCTHSKSKSFTKSKSFIYVLHFHTTFFMMMPRAPLHHFIFL